MGDKDAPRAAAGWYPDSDGVQRYWDGNAWLDIPAPSPSPSPSAFDTQRPARRRWVWIAAAAIVVILLGGGGAAFASKATADNRAAEVAAQKAAAERKQEAAQKAAAQAAQQAADDAERTRRADAVKGIEASVKEMATGHAKDHVIDGPILEVLCSPTNGGSTDDLTAKTTVFQCFVANKKNGDGTESGYYYNATMNWDTGSYTYGLGKP